MFASLPRRALTAAALTTLLSAGASGPQDFSSGSRAGPPGNFDGASRAYRVWQPGKPGECDRTIHERYSVLGPDGKLYPTWHPPIDPSGCGFGHEHGQDPRGSALARSIGAIPFGYGNERLGGAGVSAGYEEHGGHKIEWENGVIREGRVGGLPVESAARCDYLIELHRGPPAAGAPAGALRELTYHLKCSDHTERHFTVLTDADASARFIQGLTGRFVRQSGGPGPDQPRRAGGVTAPASR